MNIAIKKLFMVVTLKAKLSKLIDVLGYSISYTVYDVYDILYVM